MEPPPFLIDDAELLEDFDSALDPRFGPVELFLLKPVELGLVLEIDVGPGEFFLLGFPQESFLSLVSGYSWRGARSTGKGAYNVLYRAALCHGFIAECFFSGGNVLVLSVIFTKGEV